MFRSTLALAAPLSIVLAACSGGGGGGDGSSSGAFLDSPVSGLAFHASGPVGTTDAGGTFSYVPGVAVEFAVGALSLGSFGGGASATPVDLVSGAADETHPTVTNIARFLQTIDDDGDASNGIVIVPAVAAATPADAIDFAQSIAAFDADPAVTSLVAQLTALTAAGVRPLVPTAQAQAHLASTLLGLQGGMYSGSFSGADSGSWEAFVDATGSLVGWGVSAEDGFFDFGGVTTSDGSAVFGNVSTGAQYSGLVSDGAMNGSWQNTQFGGSGTFAGNRGLANLPFIDPDLLNPVLGSYQGTFQLGGNTGDFTLTIDPSGLVTLSDGGGGVRAGIVGADSGGVQIAGLVDDGTRISASTDTAGNLSGTLTNGFDGSSGTLSGTRQ